MKKNTNKIIINTICFLIPVLAVLIFALGSAKIDVNFSLLDPEFWSDLGLNAVAMICFYVPFEIIFSGREDSEVAQMENQFRERATKVVRANFKEWLQKSEYKKRVDDYIDEKLLSIGMSRDKYENFYRNNNKAVRKDKSLSLPEKRGLIKANRYTKIKAVEYYQIFSKDDQLTSFSRVPMSSTKHTTLRHLKKAITFVLFGVGMTAIILSTDFTKSWEAIIVSMCYRIGAGMLQIVSAYTGVQSDRRHYMSVLRERCAVIDEYLEKENFVKSRQTHVENV